MWGWPTIGVSRVDFEIHNVVACANLHQNIDLDAIKKTLVNVDYNPRRFPGLVFRLKSPRTSTLIFSTGKMVCTGAKSEKLAKRAVRKVVRKLREEGFIIRGRPDVTIENVVSTANVGGEVDLETAAADMDNLMYEPEQFPGLIYRMKEPRVVLLIFASGKMVITGAKSSKWAEEAAENMMDLLSDEGVLYKRSG